MPPKHKVDPKKLEAERLLGFLQELLKEEENKYCADCETKQPRWASWNLGVFLCIRCAGLHRNLGVHISKVKSVNLDSWTAEQVQSMRVMGNAKAKAVYEAELPHMFRRPQSDQTLEAFIRAKYESRRYILKDWQRPVVNVSDLPLHSNTEKPMERGNAYSTSKPTSKLQQSTNNVASCAAKRATPISSTSQAPVLIDFSDMSVGNKDSSVTHPSSNNLDDIFGPIVSAPPNTAAGVVPDNMINSSASLAQPQQQNSVPTGKLVLDDVETSADKNSASNAEQNLTSESELSALSNVNFGSSSSAQDSKKSTSDILALFGVGGGSSSTSIIAPQQPPMLANPAMLSNFVSSAAPQHFPQQQKPMGGTLAASGTIDGGMNGGTAAVMMSPHMSAPSFAAFQQTAPPIVNASTPLSMPHFSASSHMLHSGLGSAAPSNLFGGGGGNVLFDGMSGASNGTMASSNNNNLSGLDDLFDQFKM